MLSIGPLKLVYELQIMGCLRSAEADIGSPVRQQLGEAKEHK